LSRLARRLLGSRGSRSRERAWQSLDAHKFARNANLRFRNNSGAKTLTANLDSSIPI
jgi:hypothetical protein